MSSLAYFNLIVKAQSQNVPAAPSSEPLGVDSADNLESKGESKQVEAVSDSESVAESDIASEYDEAEDEAEDEGASESDAEDDHESGIQTRSRAKRKADGDIDTAVRKSARNDTYDDDQHAVVPAAQASMYPLPAVASVAAMRAFFDYASEADRQSREREIERLRHELAMARERELRRERDRGMDLARATILRSLGLY